MPRAALLLDAMHCFCQRVQCWEYSGVFMSLNPAAQLLGITTYSIDLLAAQFLPPESWLLPINARDAQALRNELATRLAVHGFKPDDLSTAELLVRPGNCRFGSMYGLRLTLEYRDRRIVREVDAFGYVIAPRTTG